MVPLLKTGWVPVSCKMSISQIFSKIRDHRTSRLLSESSAWYLLSTVAATVRAASPGTPTEFKPGVMFAQLHVGWWIWGGGGGGALGVGAVTKLQPASKCCTSSLPGVILICTKVLLKSCRPPSLCESFYIYCCETLLVEIHKDCKLALTWASFWCQLQVASTDHMLAAMHNTAAGGVVLGNECRHRPAYNSCPCFS